MKTIEIVEKPEQYSDETKEEGLVRNLQECIGIINNILKVLKEEKVTIVIEVRDYTLSVPNDVFQIVPEKLILESAKKDISINYVSR